MTMVIALHSARISFNEKISEQEKLFVQILDEGGEQISFEMWCREQEEEKYLVDHNNLRCSSKNAKLKIQMSKQVKRRPENNPRYEICFQDILLKSQIKSKEFFDLITGLDRKSRRERKTLIKTLKEKNNRFEITFVFVFIFQESVTKKQYLKCLISSNENSRRAVSEYCPSITYETVSISDQFSQLGESHLKEEEKTSSSFLSLLCSECRNDEEGLEEDLGDSRRPPLIIKKRPEVIFYSGTCKNSNLFSMMDESPKKNSFHVLEPSYIKIHKNKK